MAKGNSKGYSAGGGKKWLIAIALIVLVAIVVVVVLICIPPNTYNAVQTLNRTTQSSFLVKSPTDKENFNDLKNKLGAGEKFNVYQKEMEDYALITDSIYNILDFYNDNLIFASSNKNLKKNFKPIKNNLNDAKAIQGRLSSALVKMKDIARDTDSMRNAIIDFRNEFVKWLKANQKAFVALNSAYSGSMGNILENNLASRIILNTADEMLSELIAKIELANDFDKKGASLDKNYYKAEAMTGLFTDFVNKNIKNENSAIKNYYFDEAIQTNYQKFDKFIKTYPKDALSQVIESVRKENGKIVFTKTFEGVEDADGVYNTVKILLGGQA